MAASTSCAKQNLVTMYMKEPSSNYNPYPPPLARYEDVVASAKLFMATLEKLHATMGTKFMIPIIGGRELDLHKLFVEVTSRGGIEKIIRERRWKEVTAVFNFPSTATNASFVLRKYYFSLLHHYEQLYFFKARGWVPASADSFQSPSTAPMSGQGAVGSSQETQANIVQQTRIDGLPGATAASSASMPVIGVIDGKFESGYLVTVTIGSEKLKGVLYQAPQSSVQQVPQQYGVFANTRSNTHSTPGVQRRRRRKKSEIRRRDPAHPKPNRSGYNFFFAEQHARLKPLHPGKDREISRMIGELWNKLKESERTVYQEKARKDKERYRIEMEDYKERLRTGQVVKDAMPLQQRLPLAAAADVDMTDADSKIEEMEGREYPESPENESYSGESECEDDRTTERDMNMEICHQRAGDSGNLGIGNLTDGSPFHLLKGKEIVGSERGENVGVEDEENVGDTLS